MLCRTHVNLKQIKGIKGREFLQMIKEILNWSLRRSTGYDAFFLSLLVVLITWNPYYLHQKINLFELGLYLPGIDSILKGQIPYRDFFYLRGPFEIYVPAFFMKLGGENISVLATYFYAGTVIALIICVWIARVLLQTRLMLWIFVPVLIASTFTRVVFTYWGGMRYALGLLVLLLMVYFFQTRRPVFLFLSGSVSALALMTSIEIGVCLLPAAGTGLFLCMLYERKNIRFWLSCFFSYTVGFITVMSAFIASMVTSHSLMPFLETVYAVVFNSHPTFATYLTSSAPRTLPQFILAMVPGVHNFKYMTPMYLYIILGVYLLIGFIIELPSTKENFRTLASVVRPTLLDIWLDGSKTALVGKVFRTHDTSVDSSSESSKVGKEKLNKWKLGPMDFAAMVIGMYGFILYLAAFRIIEGGQFETALQPEKILLFFILERAYFFLKTRGHSGVLKIFVAVLIISSLGFSLEKYFHRFFVFKYAASFFSKKKERAYPLYGMNKMTLTVPRAQGMVTTADQGEEIEQVVHYVQAHSSGQDYVFAYPDRGAYSFLMDRPYVSRFPTACLSWMNERWHSELMFDLKRQRPRLAVLAKNLGPDYWNVYFTRIKNREHYDEVINYIRRNYLLIQETPNSYIYKIQE